MIFDIILFLIFFYILVSLIEWTLHYFVMHFNEPAKGILEYLNTSKSHIEHHKKTNIDQSLTDDYSEESLVFNFILLENYAILGVVFVLVYLYWRFFPGFKKYSLALVFVFVSFVYFFYLYLWGSIHSYYHKRYVDSNKPAKNDPNMIVYCPLKFFKPDEENPVYKYLFWYHTLHHLTKGVDKCNYNIICPLFDFIFGTYKSNVNNTKHFSENNPQNLREEWLKNHLVFDIRVVHNTIEYKESGVWQPLPAI